MTAQVVGNVTGHNCLVQNNIVLDQKPREGKL